MTSIHDLSIREPIDIDIYYHINDEECVRPDMWSGTLYSLTTLPCWGTFIIIGSSLRYHEFTEIQIVPPQLKLIGRIEITNISL